MVGRHASAAGLPLLLALTIAACGGSGATAAPTASGGTSPGPSQAQPTAAPSAATAQPSQTDDASSGPGLAPDLEAKLPDRVGNVTFEKGSFDGGALGLYGGAMGLDDSALGPLLAANNKTLNDVRFAIATPTTSGATAFIYAIQIKGVPAVEFMDELGSFDTSEQLSLGGKTVYGSVTGDIGSVAYPKDDVVYLVLALGPGMLEDMVASLP